MTNLDGIPEVQTLNHVLLANHHGHSNLCDGVGLRTLLGAHIGKPVLRTRDVIK